MPEKTLFIIDDHAEFRQSTAWMLSAMGYKVRDFASPNEGLDALVSRSPCDCLLLDLRMPDMSGLDVHDKLNKSGVSVPVIYMTGHGDVALAVKAMKKGAVNFLEKPIQVKTLQRVISTALESQHLKINADVDAEVISEFRQNLKQLTPREKEVMHSIVNGKANKVTAYDLGISIKTVELHRSRVMHKLPVKSSQELVKLVMLCH